MFEIKDLPKDFTPREPRRKSKLGFGAADLKLDEIAVGKGISFPATYKAAFPTLRTYVCTHNKKGGSYLRCLVDANGNMWIGNNGAKDMPDGVTASEPVAAIVEPAETHPTYDEFLTYLSGMSAGAEFAYIEGSTGTTLADRIELWCADIDDISFERAGAIVSIRKK